VLQPRDSRGVTPLNRVARKHLEDVLLPGVGASIRGPTCGAFPAGNVGSTPNSVQVVAFMPGIDPKAEAKFRDGVLHVSVARRFGSPSRAIRRRVTASESDLRDSIELLRGEVRSPHFRRSCVLSQDPDSSKIEATLRRHTHCRVFAFVPMSSRRPVFLNVLRIGMPVGAWTSIGHRISGVVLAASVPPAAWLLDLSLRDPAGFARVHALLISAFGKAAAIVVVWSLAHHVLAGLRHLASDLQIGSSLAAARRSAWVANVGGAVVAIVTAGALL